MHAENTSGSRGPAGRRRRSRRPRVVIFDTADSAEVEVLDLPEDAKPGHRICHDGRHWIITGSRTGARVLIAQPEAN